MEPAEPTFEDVLRIVQQWRIADQARLVERIMSEIAASLEQAQPASPLSTDDILARLPPDSPAGRLVRDPNSALARLLAIAPPGFVPPTDEELEQWRDERLMERYGA